MRIFTTLATLGLAAAFGLGAAAPADAQQRITIGTGGTGGLFYVVGAGMAELINNHMEGATARAEVTGASVENIRRVAAGQMDIGFSSSSTLYEASVGEGPFEEALPVAAVAYLYPAVLQLATVAGSGIETVDDLAGKRVNLGPPGSNSAVLAERLLAAYGVEVQPQFLSYAEGTNAIFNGVVDAVFVLAGAPTAALIDLGAQRDMRMISIDEGRVAGMLEEYPFYQIYEIAAGTYEGQGEGVLVINDPAALFTHADADEALVYGITSTIFGHLDELGEVHPQARAIAVETGPQTPIELHPGARRFFEEQGVALAR